MQQLHGIRQVRLLKPELGNDDTLDFSGKWNGETQIGIELAGFRGIGNHQLGSQRQFPSAIHLRQHLGTRVILCRIRVGAFFCGNTLHPSARRCILGIDSDDFLVMLVGGIKLTQVEFALRHVEQPAHGINIRRVLLCQRWIVADRVIKLRAEGVCHRIVGCDSVGQHFVHDRLGFGDIAFTG